MGDAALTVDVSAPAKQSGPRPAPQGGLDDLRRADVVDRRAAAVLIMDSFAARPWAGARLPDRRPAGKSVAVRLCTILDVVADAPNGLKLTEVSRRSGMPISTAFRLLGVLVDWGGIERDEDGRYAVGLKLWEIASRTRGVASLREAALPFMSDLYEVTRQNVQLAVRNGHEAVYLERLSAPRAVHTITQVGGRLPLHATGVGQVLLANAPHMAVNQILGAPLRRYTPRTLTCPDELRRRLWEVRQAGFAVCEGEIELAAMSVAAPIRIGVNVVAALSIVVPSDGEPARYYVPAICAAAAGISRALGASHAEERVPS